MKIKRLELISFGNIENLTIDPLPGLNIITGANESGKSTVAAFIRALFYGFLKPMSSQKRLDQVLYGKYKPWFTGSYAGYADIEFKGTVYRIQHNFNDSSFSVSTPGTRTSVADQYEFDDIREVGEYFLGINSLVYDNVISLNLGAMSFKSDAIKEINKIILYRNGEAPLRLSAGDAVTKLEKKLDEIGTLKAKTKKLGSLKTQIDRTKSEMSELMGDLYNNKLLRNKLTSLHNRKKVLTNSMVYIEALDRISVSPIMAEELRRRLRDLEDNLENYEQLGLKNLNFEDYSYLIQLEKDSEQCKSAVSSLESKLDKMKSLELRDTKLKRMENYIDAESMEKAKELLLLRAVVVLGVFLVLMYLSIKNISDPIYRYVAIGVAALISVLVFMSTIRENPDSNVTDIDQQSEINGEESHDSFDISDLERELTAAKTELLRLNGEIREFRSCKYDGSAYEYGEMMALKEKYKDLLNSKSVIMRQLGLDEASGTRGSGSFTLLEEFKNLDSVAIDEYSRNLYELDRQISNAEHELIQNEISVQKYQSLDEKVDTMSREYKKLVDERASISLALYTLKSALGDLSTEEDDRLIRKINNRLFVLTDGKYSSVVLTEELQVSLYEPREKRLTPIEMLSSGAVDQVYLSVKLAILDLYFTGDNPIPLILDDCFLQYDDERLKNVLRVLSRESLNRQVIILTCTNREVTALNEEGIFANIIKI